MNQGAVLVALSGGVDSSVAAAELIDAGYRVTAITMKLWGGDSDSGCCSVSDVDDARRAADHLGIDHHVFNFGDAFESHVVEQYVAAHATGRTPNPCIECNRHLKFGVLLDRARALGFDAVATGHHARVVERAGGVRHISRGADRAKDQSYVLYMLGQDQLRRLVLPIGHMTKAEVRARAGSIGLRTATKPDSQDVCFITAVGGRERFLGDRMTLTPGRVVDSAGEELGRVEAVELVTIGQRKGLGVPGGVRRYAVSVDLPTATVRLGRRSELLTDTVELIQMVWANDAVSGLVAVQVSAHGRPLPATVEGCTVRFTTPQRRVAPGQSVVLYDGDEVLGGGIAV